MPANVGLWGGVACLLGLHVRSRGQAHATADGWVSRCARCAVPMARAHGGGKWQVVKTPKRRKPGAKASSQELLEKAIVKSKIAGARKEKKEALLAEKAAAAEAAAKLRHVYGDPIEEEAPVESKRRFLSFFRRKKRSGHGETEETGARKRRFFLRKARVEGDAPPAAKRRLFRRKAKMTGEAPSNSGRRFFFFRRKAVTPDAVESTEPAAETTPTPKSEKPKSPRRKKPQALEGAGVLEKIPEPQPQKAKPARHKKQEPSGSAGAPKAETPRP